MNWFEELEEIHKEDSILAVAVDGQLFHHLSEAKPFLDIEFDDDLGAAEGKPFTAWSETKVYFPTEYDGSENWASVNRFPCPIATEHI